MQNKFSDWHKVCLWAIKDCDEFLKSLYEKADTFLSQVMWNESLMSRSSSLKKAWHGFCESMNIEIKENESSIYLSMKKNEAKKYFVTKAIDNEPIEYDESLIMKKIDEMNTRNNLHCPRIKATCESMLEVQKFITENKYIDLSSLELCHSTLQFTSKFETLSFIKSCLEETEEELYFEIPTEILSKMNGKPCRTRDLENANLSLGIKKLFGTPSLLVSTSSKFSQGSIQLLGRSGSVLYELQGGGCITPIPTSSTIEQFVIVTDIFSGECKLLSSTRRNLELIGLFTIEKPEEYTIDWIECVNCKGKTVLLWGGSDPLRGKITWSHFSGINVEALHATENDFFYEVPDDSHIEILDDVIKQGKQDFSKHGNILTLWTQTVDDEDYLRGRTWKEQQQLIFGNCFKIDYLLPPNIHFVWGSHLQFALFYKMKDKFCCDVIENGKLKSQHYLPSDYYFHGAVLYSHSR